MLVGPTGGGKTVVINALVKAQTHMGLPTKCLVLNPKVSGPPNAIKELQIERGVQAVIETWATMAFKTFKHYKGSDDRGWVLGPVDEIMQILEDNAMNLQSMGASQ